MEQIPHLFYIIAFPAILLVGISKTGFLRGATYITIPALALFISPILVVGITLPILLIMDIYGVIMFHKNHNWSVYFKLLPAAVVGVVAGVATINYISEDHIRIIIGVTCIGYALSYFLATGPKAAPNIIMKYLLVIYGGFSSSLIHSGSPCLHKAIAGQGLTATQIASTTVVFFTSINLIKLIPYISLGLVNSDTLHIAMLLFPLAPIGVYIGAHSMEYAPKEQWFKVIHCCAILVGLGLMAQGLSLI